MKINNQEVKGYGFAYDECHKIYLIEDKRDEEEAEEIGYDIYSLEEIEEIYDSSCPLRFIHNWKLDKTYAEQFEEATFEY